MKLAESFVDDYLKLLNETAAKDKIFRPKVIRLLEYLKDGINNRHIPFSISDPDDVYSLLGYHDIFNYFDKIVITDETLRSYSILRKLIDELKTIELSHNGKQLFYFIEILQEFKNKELDKALDNYKNTLTEGFKKAFEQLCEDVTTLNISNLLYQKIKTELERQNQQQQDQFTKDVMKNGFFSGVVTILQGFKKKFSISYQKEEEPAAYFFFSLLTLQYKDKVTLKDILELKNKATSFKEYLLELPEVSTIDEYATLINVLCNFINACAACFTKWRPFESEKTKAVHTYFFRWDNTFSLIEEKQNIVNNPTSRL